MGYTLDLEHDLPTAARDTVREQLDKGAEDLTSEGHADDPVTAIHDARKRVKKSRALLRLVRPGLGEKRYKRENRMLRDAARTVAGARDADVMVETVDALREHYAGRLPADRFESVRAALAEEAEQSRGKADPSLLATALRKVSGRVDDWPLEGACWPMVNKGLTKAYGRGRKAFASADADPTTENLHEWRKRVKDLWYHQRLLKPAWPDVLGAQADEAHRLADLLGDDHDLAVLAERLEHDPPSDGAGEVLELIEERRAELLAEVRALGRRVYAEKPKQFARRMSRYLDSATAHDAALA
jgi:CHAD domain-containing protein